MPPAAIDPPVYCVLADVPEIQLPRPRRNTIAKFGAGKQSQGPSLRFEDVKEESELQRLGHVGFGLRRPISGKVANIAGNTAPFPPPPFPSEEERPATTHPTPHMAMVLSEGQQEPAPAGVHDAEAPFKHPTPILTRPHEDLAGTPHPGPSDHERPREYTFIAWSPHDDLSRACDDVADLLFGLQSDTRSISPEPLELRRPQFERASNMIDSTTEETIRAEQSDRRQAMSPRAMSTHPQVSDRSPAADKESGNHVYLEQEFDRHHAETNHLYPKRFAADEEADITFQSAAIIYDIETGRREYPADPAFNEEMKLIAAQHPDLNPRGREVMGLALRHWIGAVWYEEIQWECLTKLEFGPLLFIDYRDCAWLKAHNKTAMPPLLKLCDERIQYVQELHEAQSASKDKAVASAPAMRHDDDWDGPLLDDEAEVPENEIRSPENPPASESAIPTDTNQAADGTGSHGGEANLDEVADQTQIASPRAAELPQVATAETNEVVGEAQADDFDFNFDDDALAAEEDDDTWGFGAQESEHERSKAAQEAEKAKEKEVRQRNAENLADAQTSFRAVRERVDNPTGNVRSDFDEVVGDIVDYYEAFANEWYDSSEDPDRTKLNVWHAIVRGPNGESLPALCDVIDIEPKVRGQVWGTDTLIQFLLETRPASLLPRHFLVTEIGYLHYIANKEIEEDTMEDWYQGIFMENQSKIAAGQPGDYPAAQMPPDCQVLHLVYNPSGCHWVEVEFQVNHKKKKGTITVFDSIKKAKGHSKSRMRVDLPWFAKLVSQRPGLGWDDIEWQPATYADCAQQANSNDCALFAEDTAERRVSGTPLECPRGERARDLFGVQLRWNALVRVATKCTGKTYPEPNFADAEIRTRWEEEIISLRWGADGQRFESSFRRLMMDAVRTAGGVGSVRNMVEYIEDQRPGVFSRETLQR